MGAWGKHIRPLLLLLLLSTPYLFYLSIKAEKYMTRA
jgi:hypothetical protein